MFDPDLCRIPICSSTDHDLISMLVVRCPHTQGTTVHLKQYDDQVTQIHERTIALGPFDSTGDLSDVLRAYLFDRIPR